MIKTFVYFLYSSLPARMRYKLKSILSGVGHSVGVLDSLKSAKDARGKKRLDRSLVHMIDVLRFNEIDSLSGMTCVDFGGGYVITDAISMYLLGSDNVVAIDYNRIANERATKLAVGLVDVSVIKDSVSRIGLSLDVEKRFIDLERALSSGFSGLQEVGIRYLAPFDYSNNRLQEPVDFLFSTSVLEHLHPSLVEPIINNILSDMADGAIMHHNIHLEDHMDFEGNPFEFLSMSTDYILSRDFDSRGNRVRVNHWINIFESIPGFSLKVNRGAVRVGHGVLIPNELLDGFSGCNHNDLFCPNVTISAKKLL